MLISFLVNALAVFLSAYILPGVQLVGLVPTLVVTLVLVLLNTFIKPILVILTLPLHIITLGLTLLVLNACIILLADSLVAGFGVDGFIWALIFSLVLSLVSTLLSKATNGREL